MKLYKILLLLCLFFSINAYADPHSDISAADSAYAQGKYSRSVELYEKLINENGATASLLYNLGNAYYKNGNEGEARLCLERAKRLDPSDKRIDKNIEYISARVEDANKAELKGKKGSVSPDPKGFFGRMHDKIAVDTSSNSWAEMAAMAFILLILSLTLYFFSKEVRFKKIGFFSSFIFLFFSVCFVIFSEMAATQFESKDSVVLTSFKATLLQEPGEEEKPVGAPLHRGTILQILDSEMNVEGEVSWYKLKLNSSNIGWLPASDVTII